MLDIVATIQAEQDEVIRSPLAGVLVVQGGPGSGKTAVGLHRAAFLLYGDEVLARQQMLVLGPNRVFLRYIAQVLPSLGEEAVVQTTVRDLAPGVRVLAEDDPACERVKGDGRMAVVLARALALGRRGSTPTWSCPSGCAGSWSRRRQPTRWLASWLGAECPMTSGARRCATCSSVRSWLLTRGPGPMSSSWPSVRCAPRCRWRRPSSGSGHPSRLPPWCEHLSPRRPHWPGRRPGS